ncbi:MAG TPA: transposase [Isosphaeraceae bacterium]|nr:transposase [Isosphaeraceae bacterium]
MGSSRFATTRYQARTGCQWEMLPHDLLPKSSVYDYFAQWCDDGTWQRMVDALRPVSHLSSDMAAVSSVI